MKQWIVTGLMVIMMGVGSTVWGFFEDRMHCRVDEGQVRVALDEGGTLCTEYREDIAQAIDRAETLTQTTYRYSQQASNDQDAAYRSALAVQYQLQERQLRAFATKVEMAMMAFERTVLLRVQGYLSPTLELDKLRCMNTRPTLKALYTHTRYPLCRLGQERQINTMQTTDDLDEFVDALRSYVGRRQRILDEQ